MRKRFVVPVVAALTVTLAAGPAAAARGGPQEGTYYQDPVTADRPVPTPPTPSCTVNLAADYTTNDSSGAFQAYNGTFTPPADCPGPWAKVVLDFTGRETGRQYDRAGDITFGGARIFFTSTPEPDPDGITWHAQKDVTEYSSLFTPGQPYTISVPNYLNSLDTGVMHIDANLTFYRADAAHPAPRTPDEVIGLGTQSVSSSGDVATYPVNDLPTNIDRAVLEVYPKGNACDEFWYGGLPDDYVAANPGQGLCGGGPYRELDASLDGTPAGATIPFPNVFTGGINPLIWRPIPAVDAFDLKPRYLNLTPFVGSLVDGGSHTLTMSVRNAQSYWQLTPNLLIYRDAGTTQTSGGLLRDSLATHPTSIRPHERTTDGGVDYRVKAKRSYTVSGWVRTSTGRVVTTVRRTLDFANADAFTLQDFRQKVTNRQTIDTTVATADASGVHTERVRESDPITLKQAFEQPAGANYWVLPASAEAGEQLAITRTDDGRPTFASRLRNVTGGQGTLSEFTDGTYRQADGSDHQLFAYNDSTGACYRHLIRAAHGWVTFDHLVADC